MKLFSKIALLIILLGLSCKLEKDNSNDPLSLLARFLIRNSIGINPELPSDLSVALPRSIRKSSSSISAVLRGSNSFAKSSTIEDLVNGDKTGLGILQGGTTIIGAILQDSKRDLFLLSNVYDIAKKSPGVCIPGGRTSMNFPGSAIDEILSGLKRLGFSDSDAKSQLSKLQSEGIIPNVGQTILSPAIIYRVPEGKTYDHEISFSFNDSLGSPKPCPSKLNSLESFDKTIRWKADKSQVYSYIQRKLNFLTVKINISASITYFTSPGKKDRSILQTKKSISFGSNAPKEVNQTLTVEECLNDSDANSDNCVALNFRSKEKLSDKLSIEVTINGKTDNDGGNVISTIKELGDDATAPFEIKIEEYYNGTGDVVYAEYSEDSVYIGSYGYDNGEYYEYGFDENNLFDGFIDLYLSPFTASCGILPCIGESIPIDYSDFESFVLVVGTGDPNTDEDLIVGYGYFEDDVPGGVTGFDDDSEVEIYYYGEEEDIPNVKVWRETYDDPWYELTTNTVTQ